VDGWWRQQRHAAPNLFFPEFTSAVERLASMPGSGAVFDSTSVPGTRRILLPTWGHHLDHRLAVR
jgi:hypothetical protein